MLNSPMVIMWANDDGTITLSQREASAYSMPQVVSSPDRVATLSESLSSVRHFQLPFIYIELIHQQTSDSSMTFTFTVDVSVSFIRFQEIFLTGDI